MILISRILLTTITNIFLKKVTLHTLTDRLSLFGVFTKSQVAKEQRLIIDLKNVKKPITLKEIGDIAFLRSEFSIADALTKMKNQDHFINTLTSNNLERPVDQPIVWDIMLFFKINKGSVSVTQLCSYLTIGISWVSLRMNNSITCSFFLRHLQSPRTL